MELYGLKVNERIHPIGIDGVPFFSWKFHSSLPDTLQTAYRIELPGLWDSGIVESKRQAFVPYGGAQLQPLTQYRWKVSVWDNHGRCASGEGEFETANPAWKAKWAESTILRNAQAYDYENRNAENILDQTKSGLKPGATPILFTRAFTLKDKPLRARVYATACGVYRLTINGTRPDDREFAPEFTSYEKLHYYQTYDVTDLLRPGENNLQMYVGDGWYFSDQATPILGENRKAYAVLYQLELWYADGSRQTVYSNGSETCTTGYILSSDIFQGEIQDHRRNFGPECPVTLSDPDYSRLAAQPMEPIRPMILLPAQSVFVTPKGETVVDFGQIIAGRARIKLDLPAGQEAVFRYFEILDADGNYINTMYAPQTDRVISNGKPIAHEALFTFHGFRYIAVNGMENVCPEDFSAVLLTTQKENLGEFHCSEPRLNRLYENIRWSQRNNMMSIPTDCPSREKAGWTGDILVYARTALTNENVTPFLTAWLRNVRADQGEDGVVMITSPFEKLYNTLIRGICSGFGDDGPTNVAGWSDAIVWVPYEMYCVTGNTAILQENFDAMTRFCDKVIATANSKGTPWLFDSGFHFGEWLIPSEPVGGFEICKQSAFYVAPMYAYMTMKKMVEICHALGEPGKQYSDAAQNMKKAILNHIRLPDKMGAYVLALAFDLVPEGMEQDYQQKLLALIKRNNYCLDTGFLATPYLLDVLCDMGQWETAHKVFWQNKMPGWFYQVDNGATAIWEAWNADEARHTGRFVSFDHYAYGIVDDWIMRKLCGIDCAAPGFDEILIAPVPDPNITHLYRKFETVHGAVEVSYDEECLQVTIPPNASAKIVWKNISTDIGSGHYEFR